MLTAARLRSSALLTLALGPVSFISAFWRFVATSAIASAAIASPTRASMNARRWVLLSIFISPVSRADARPRLGLLLDRLRRRRLHLSEVLVEATPRPSSYEGNLLPV